MMKIVSNHEFDENALIAFSKTIGRKLPNEYIAFLREHNGGVIQNSISTYDKNGEHTFILTSMFGLQSDDDLLDQFETYKNRIPATCIPIGRDAGGNLVCLTLSEGNYGSVYFWDHEEELHYEESSMVIDDLYFIAASFKAFLHSIKRDDIKASETGRCEVKKVWIDPDFLKELENNSDQ